MTNDAIRVPEVHWSEYVDYSQQLMLPCPGDPNGTPWDPETAHQVVALVTEGPRPFRCRDHQPRTAQIAQTEPIAPLAAVQLRPCAYHQTHEPEGAMTVLRANGEAVARVCLPALGRPQAASVPKALWPPHGGGRGLGAPAALTHAHPASGVRQVAPSGQTTEEP